MYRFFEVLAGLAALGLISRLKRHDLLLLTSYELPESSSCQARRVTGM